MESASGNAERAPGAEPEAGGTVPPASGLVDKRGHVDVEFMELVEQLIERDRAILDRLADS
jgi:hypothetical protein